MSEPSWPILRVGCAMWADRSWVGRYFPADTSLGRELVPYSSWCNAVEGNTTFYGLPSQATVARWAADCPESFRFMFKLPKSITHERRLRNVEADVTKTLERLAPLQGRTSSLSVQLPASFEPDDLDTLGRFLRRVPKNWSFAVEVRHEQFCSGGDDEHRLNDLLRQSGAERIIIDTRAVFAGPRTTGPEIEAFERKPRLPVRPVAIGNQPVVRFIGQTDVEANPTWWSKWIPKVVQWLAEGRSPTVFIHTPDNAVAPELARSFHAEVAESFEQETGRRLESLPEPLLAASQLKLI